MLAHLVQRGFIGRGLHRQMFAQILKVIFLCLIVHRLLLLCVRERNTSVHRAMWSREHRAMWSREHHVTCTCRKADIHLDGVHFRDASLPADESDVQVLVLITSDESMIGRDGIRVRN